LKSGNAAEQHLSEKMQFCASAFIPIMQKHNLGEVGNKAIFIAYFLLIFVQTIIEINSRLSSYSKTKW